MDNIYVKRNKQNEIKTSRTHRNGAANVKAN